MRASISNPANGKIRGAPTIKKPTPKVIQIRDNMPKKSTFCRNEEDLLGLNSI